MEKNAQQKDSTGKQLVNLLYKLIWGKKSKGYWINLSEQSQHQLLQLARDTGLGPLLHYYFRQNGIDIGDYTTLSTKLFLAGSGMAIQRQMQLKTIISLFQRHDIEIIVLKGAWTAETLYPHPGLRTMHDIDIMLKPENEKTAYKLLKSNGYKPLAGEYNSPKHLPSLTPERQGLPIEMHHDISGRSSLLTATRLWQYSESAEISGIKTRVFIPEMVFLHHCLHMVEEYFGNGIKNITEAAFLVAAKNFDPDKLIIISNKLKLSTTLSLSLAIVDKLYGLNIPELNDRLPQVPEKIIKNSCELIFRENCDLDKTSAMLSRECSALSVAEKTIFLFRRTFIAPAQIAGMYNCSKYSLKLPLCYIHRIFKYMSSVPQICSLASKEKKTTSHETGLKQREIIDYCQTDNYVL